MTYGRFDDPSCEYVITNPKTPVKWINYVGTLAFGGFVDHTGGALICKDDPALNRITKYIAQLPSSEFKGTTLYLRIRLESGYRVFSPYYVPTLDRYELYECHVGLGYSRFVSQFYGLCTEAIVFVPMGQSCLLADIRITNMSGQPLAVDAIPVVEYTHFDALKQLTNADWVPQTMQSKAYHDPLGRIALVQYAFMRRDTCVNYLTSNRPASSFESERRSFLGDHEYGTWASPLSLQNDELSNGEAQRGDNIGALLHHLAIIHPGQTTRLITQVGQAASVAHAWPSIERFRDPAEVDRAFEELAAYWRGYLSRMQVQTPDTAMNRMLNVHNPRQCHVTKTWSRYLSLYQLGFGARGIGFRDSAQDVLGILAHMPDEGRELIRQLLHVQRGNGSAMHQFNPLTMVANEGDSREMEDGPKYYSDDHLWIILAVCAYLKETGDFSFLDEVIPFYEKALAGQPLDQGTVWEHMQRAVAFTGHDLGAHGLPLLGFADWNDTVNLRQGAESLFTANLYGTALREMSALARLLGDEKTAAAHDRDTEDMRQRVNQMGWDGDWYVRYFDVDGSPLGSRRNREGQIFTNGQSWPVISGFAPPDRGRLAMDAVHRLLSTGAGIKLSMPGYDGYDPAKGGVTTYPPGAKENGGIFLHANPWAIIAEAILGNGERAYQYYVQINPVAKNDRIDEYECEPYVYAQNILGNEHPHFGLARNSWLTGTASWAYVAATQYILGIRPTYAGLQIDPCIPSRWKGFRVTREFRGAVYEIEVDNPHGVSKGVAAVLVDGRTNASHILPAFADGQTHHVHVTMG